MKENIVKGIVKFGHHEAIKHWLRISDFKPYTASTEEDYNKLLEHHIAEGNLRIDQLRRLTLEISEYGGKRIYLGKLINYKTIELRQRFENHLRRMQLKIDDVPERKTELPSKPHLDYITWSPQEVRIGFSETHEMEVADKETHTWKTNKQTNYITISADPRTGTVNLIMDAPLETHQHLPGFRRDDSLGYVPYYRAQVVKLLGVDEFKDIDLLKASRGIANSPSLFFRKRTTDRSAQNSRITVSSNSDVSDDPAYTEGVKHDGKNHAWLILAGHWLPEGSNKQLLRRIFMHLNCEEKMIQFPGYNLSSEVEYAISRIRSI
jgi:hypothetical protein